MWRCPRCATVAEPYEWRQTLCGRVYVRRACRHCQRRRVLERYRGRAEQVSTLRASRALAATFLGPSQAATLPAEALFGCAEGELADRLAENHPLELRLPNRTLALEAILPLHLFSAAVPEQRRAALHHTNLRVVHRADCRGRGGRCCGWTAAWERRFLAEAARVRQRLRGHPEHVCPDPVGVPSLVWPLPDPPGRLPVPAPPEPPAAPRPPEPLPLSVALQPVRCPLRHVDFNELLGPPPA